MVLEQQGWRDDAEKDVCTHVNVISFTPIGEFGVPCADFQKNFQ
jgi:hypothetical protein